MDPWEFVYWQAYDRIDPFGEERADWRVGLNTASNINLHISRNSDPVKVGDMMWKYTPRDQVVEMDPDDLAAKLEASLSALLGPPSGMILPPSEMILTPG